MDKLSFAGRLIAQSSDVDHFALSPFLIIPLILFGLLAVGCIALLLVFRHMRRAREILHTERMKALEVGLPWQDPDDVTSEKKFMHNAFWIAFWMVVVGCGASFGAASSLVEELRSVDASIAIVAWLSAAGASIAAVTCATVLMVKSRASPTNGPGSVSKPRAVGH